MIIGYARVSTVGQNLDNQIEQLKEQGAEKIYKEQVTATSTKQRVELKAMIENVRSGDIVVVAKIDRLARSISDLNKIVTELNTKGVSVKFLKEQMTFEAGNNNSLNTLLFNILGSFAQFERDLIVERTSEGRERAKANGKKFGRKSSSTDKDIAKAIELYKKRSENKLSVADILKMTDVKKSTFYHELKKVRYK
ncbi:recombinase family protein [Staphylococcus pseudintermedius]|uniref:recombinase family protein n=1 Tax=Staphylococcus pseudintermedius TaxID=283734 RepID=UPI000CDE9F9A|nr:recombinase family protein [Staphylococcus pseudintermedius]EGQ1307329.1 recombinase family protein [Staphylococcus pseudintermedius]EGQ1602491.1 recombinase family protein [Staphylococcus pseudintermedius]EGQ1632050.1 recombinase family protein [Staphylococcus pseudintermedius]EGQ1641926.1 recombinase family protein [Staphylococcus pseudintermedius]EGQ2693094.1 recombinase family protein [Staphylococcus pseudintermedius]